MTTSFLEGEHIDLVRRALVRLASDCPVFASPALSLTIVDARVHRDPIDSISIDGFGHLYVAADYVKGKTVEDLQFVLAHTLLHPMLWHMARQGTRNSERYHRACDRAINQTLRETGKFSLPSGLLYPMQGQESWSTERLYDVEPEQGGEPSSEVGHGCGMVGPPSGKYSEEQLAKAAILNQAHASRTAWFAGTIPGLQAFGRLVTAPQSRVPWSTLLRTTCLDANAVAGRGDITWSRLHRRSFDNDFLYPSAVGLQGKVAVVVDVSGSVSDESLIQVVAETIAVAKECDTHIFLVVHDVNVKHATWLSETASAQEISEKFIGRGGTSFLPAYIAVGEEPTSFDGFIHFTDAMPCDEWPAKPPNVVGDSLCGLISMAELDAVPSWMRTVLVDIETVQRTHAPVVLLPSPAEA